MLTTFCHKENQMSNLEAGDGIALLHTLLPHSGIGGALGTVSRKYEMVAHVRVISPGKCLVLPEAAAAREQEPTR